MKEIWEAEWQDCIECGQKVMTWAEPEDALCDECWHVKHDPPRQKDICPYCNKPIEDRGEWDHVIPRCQGGSSFQSNIVHCCKQCNQEKSGRTPEQWLGHEVDFRNARFADRRYQP